MVIFGTIGIFRRYIPLSSGMIALVRGLIGTAFLLEFMLLSGKKPSGANIKGNLLLLAISGALIGFNWILLFESYRYTTVATATLCYYMAPVFVMIASPVILKERLSIKKILCIFAAVVGMLLVSGILNSGSGNGSEIIGVIFGLGAALLYASVILINKRLGSISAYDKTSVQLGFATAVLIPYVLLTESFATLKLDSLSVVMLIIVGVIHTGITYTMYFGSMNGLSAQTVALFSYIDPIVAIALSALLLKEPMDEFEIAGTVLILGATLASELSFKRKTK